MNRPERIPVGDRVTIYRRGKKGWWTADFWLDGQHRRTSLKTTNKKYAIERAQKIDADILGGTYAKPISEIPIETCVEQYIAFLNTENRSPKTITKYTGVYKVFCTFLKSKSISSMGKFGIRHFDGYRAFRHDQGAHVKTRYTEGVIIKQLFNWAKSRQIIRENPLADVKLEKPRLEPRPGPTHQQVNQILSAMSGPDRTAIAILAFTGIRSGELQRLQVGDIDDECQWLSVVSRTGLETKTRQSRRIPIHPRLRTELANLSKRSRTWLVTDPRAAQNKSGNSMLNVNKLNVRFLELLRCLGMPVGRAVYGFTLHSLRHYFETFTVNNRVPQRVVDAWLGHTGDRSMGSVYYRLDDMESLRFMNEVPFGTGTGMMPENTEG